MRLHQPARSARRLGTAHVDDQIVDKRHLREDIDEMNVGASLNVHPLTNDRERN
jgi:hypothetical protein